MIRIIAIQLVLFFLPTLIYMLWAQMAKTWGWKRIAVPTYALMVAGGILVLAGLTLSTYFGAPAGSKYQPAQFIDGKMVDGRFSSDSDQK